MDRTLGPVAGKGQISLWLDDLGKSLAVDRGNLVTAFSLSG